MVDIKGLPKLSNSNLRTSGTQLHLDALGIGAFHREFIDAGCPAQPRTISP
jgi:hypothetical protein